MNAKHANANLGRSAHIYLQYFRPYTSLFVL